MKKWLAVFIVMLMAVPCYAANVNKEIIDTTLNTTTPFTAENLYIGDAEKVSFFVTYDSSRATAAVTANVTMAASIDGINWTDISWFDVAGGGIPQTSETLSLDGTYVGWMFYSLPAQQIRIRANMVNSAVYGPGETAGITVTIVENK